MLIVFGGMLALCVWLSAVVWLAVIACADDELPAGLRVVVGAVSLVLFAGGMAFVVTRSGETRLCRRGHQEWTMVGKTPALLWVCEVYE